LNAAPQAKPTLKPPRWAWQDHALRVVNEHAQTLSPNDREAVRAELVVAVYAMVQVLRKESDTGAAFGRASDDAVRAYMGGANRTRARARVEKLAELTLLRVIRHQGETTTYVGIIRSEFDGVDNGVAA
jgi:hypothetical protein